MRLASLCNIMLLRFIQVVACISNLFFLLLLLFNLMIEMMSHLVHLSPLVFILYYFFITDLFWLCWARCVGLPLSFSRASWGLVSSGCAWTFSDGGSMALPEHLGSSVLRLWAQQLQFLGIPGGFLTPESPGSPVTYSCILYYWSPIPLCGYISAYLSTW